MRYKIIIMGVIGIICAVWALSDYSWHYPGLPEHAEHALALPVPIFSFHDIVRKRTYKITNFKGKTVLVNFWASWCTPCLAEFPKFAQLARAYPKNLILILVSEDEAPGKIRGTTHDFRALPNAYIAWDENQQLAEQTFGTYQYPETFVIWPDQEIQKKIIGEMRDADMAMLQKQLN